MLTKYKVVTELLALELSDAKTEHQYRQRSKPTIYHSIESKLDSSSNNWNLHPLGKLAENKSGCEQFIIIHISFVETGNSPVHVCLHMNIQCFWRLTNALKPLNIHIQKDEFYTEDACFFSYFDSKVLIMCGRLFHILTAVGLK